MLRRIFLIISVSLFFAVSICAQGTTTGTATTTSTSSTTKSTEKKPAVFRPTKDQIKQVQGILKEKKLYTGEASGTYNDETRTGIKSFQKDSGLKQTGTLNRATLEKFGVELTDSQKQIPVSPSSLVADTPAEKKPKTTKSTSSGTSTMSTATASTGDTPKKPAPFRANIDQIKAAQKMLKDGKMYTGEETGKLDDATREGLKKYQEANKIKVTGTLNSETLDKMGIALTDAQKANVAAQATYDAAKKN